MTWNGVSINRDMSFRPLTSKIQPTRSKVSPFTFMISNSKAASSGNSRNHFNPETSYSFSTENRYLTQGDSFSHHRTQHLNNNAFSQALSGHRGQHDWQAVHAAMHQELNLIEEAITTLTFPLVVSASSSESARLKQQHLHVNGIPHLAASNTLAAMQPQKNARTSPLNLSLSSSSNLRSNSATGQEGVELPQSQDHQAVAADPQVAATTPSAAEAVFQGTIPSIRKGARSKAGKHLPPQQSKRMVALTALAGGSIIAASVLLGVWLASPTCICLFAKLPELFSRVVLPALLASGTIAAAAGCAIGLAASSAALLIISTEAVVRAAAGSRGQQMVAPSFKDVFAAVVSLCRGHPMGSGVKASQKKMMPAVPKLSQRSRMLQTLWGRVSSEVHQHLPESFLKDLDLVRKQACTKMVNNLKAHGIHCPPELVPGPSPPVQDQQTLGSM